MKTHLFYPISNTMTMCGRKLRHLSTHNPAGVDCKQCLGSYVGNPDWYWRIRGENAPRLRLFVGDEPFPELVLIWRRDGSSNRRGRVEVIYLEMRSG